MQYRSQRRRLQRNSLTRKLGSRNSGSRKALSRIWAEQALSQIDNNPLTWVKWGCTVIRLQYEGDTPETLKPSSAGSNFPKRAGPFRSALGLSISGWRKIRDNDRLLWIIPKRECPAARNAKACLIWDPFLVRPCEESSSNVRSNW